MAKAFGAAVNKDSWNYVLVAGVGYDPLAVGILVSLERGGYQHVNMRTTVPDKLTKITTDIDATGSASLTRLTVLKKWFEQNPKRLSSFIIFIARQALAGMDDFSGESGELFREASELLQSTEMYDPKLDRSTAENLFRLLHKFQCEYKNQQWGQLRIIYNRSLFLVEEALRIYLFRAGSASDGYRLATAYCENYDPKYGSNLNGPSLAKVDAMAKFLRFVEATEDSDEI